MPAGDGVEGVRVLHDELAAAEQTEAGTGFVSVLELDLVHVDRQISVGIDLGGHGGGDDFLVGGTEDELPSPTLESEEDVFHGRQPAGRLPQLGRLQHRHQHLLGAGGIHLLADQRLDPLEQLPAEGEVGVDAARMAADVAAADEQLMGDGLGVAGRIAQSAKEEPGQTHPGIVRAGVAGSRQNPGHESRRPQLLPGRARDRGRGDRHARPP